jgi:ubiquinone/menaquinone biosynthesis C-methylase UbiE
MSIQDAYNAWASQYDTNSNKTRDLEGIALRDVLGTVAFENGLEIGCGTGKNSVWLAAQGKQLTAVDFSEKMLRLAQGKVTAPHVTFVQADITKPWPFQSQTFDLVGFSLVLEHIADLAPVFQEACRVLKSRGHLYVGELHPFKQYSGTKARFDTASGTQTLACYNHHLSDFLQLGKQLGLTLVDVNEYFDDGDRTTLPRILTVLFQKP